MKYEIHPVCAAWPALSETAFNDLVTSIREYGLLIPILLCDGKILDGKERARACEIVGVEPRYETYSGTDSVDRSLALNKTRRHLSLFELATIGDELAKLKRGGDRGNQHTGGKVCAQTLASDDETIIEIGTKLGVGRSSILARRTLRKKAEPNVVEMAKAGKVGLDSAAIYARHTPREEQKKADVETVIRVGNDIKTGKLPKGKQKQAVKPRASNNPPPLGLVTILRNRFTKEEHQTITLTVRKGELKELRSLIKRVKQQANCNAATVSFSELHVIAGAFEQLVDAWVGDGSKFGRTSNPSPQSASVEGEGHGDFHLN